jgi:hypothetical protein
LVGAAFGPVHGLPFTIEGKTMYSSLTKNLETVAGIFAVIALSVLISGDAHGQTNVVMAPLPAPPPLRLVPRDERSQLDAARDAKGRTRLSMELAEGRLSRAEAMTQSQQFESAARELGIYQGILEDALRFLKEQKDQKKLRDIYRRFEISLRSHGARLETIRRTTPSEYSINIKTITDSTKNLRGEALNGFYGDTVIRDISEDSKAPDDEKTAGSSQVTPKDAP